VFYTNAHLLQFNKYNQAPEVLPEPTMLEEAMQTGMGDRLCSFTPSLITACRLSKKGAHLGSQLDESNSAIMGAEWVCISQSSA
jgi:hypothetical protein